MKKLQEGLPYLYGWKHYKWSRVYFESTNYENFLVAANQIGKSSINIRKCIHWATAKELWPELWNTEILGPPNQFWYLYPTRDVATIEFKTKWSLFLPKGEFKNHPVYGWHAEFSQKQIMALHFNSGVSVYFKTYSQNVMDLQTGTCFAMFCFAGDTEVMTPNGAVPISEIREGDLVLSHLGFRRVSKVMRSYSTDVVEARFSGGMGFFATQDHPIITDGKQVPLIKLTDTDTCHTAPLWKLISRLSYLRRCFTGEPQRTPIIGKGTILSRLRVGICTLPYGRRTIKEVFQKAMLSITSILIHWIITSRIYSVLHAQNTHAYTSYKNGGRRRSIPMCAKDVGCSSLERAIVLFAGFVPVNVPRILGNVMRFVGFVQKLLGYGRTSLEDIVLNPVPTRQEVYNLEVEDANTYYANGVLVHNCDEELPVELLPELQARLNASDGFFHLVFTATLGQEHWRKCLEEQGKPLETHKNALKLNVSLFDCMEFEDGTKSHWTKEKIERAIAKCPTKNEVLRRIYGRFVVGDGLKYAAFDHERNSCHPIAGKDYPPGWMVYSAVDIGSGGKSGHPAAIIFVAVSPDFKQGRVFRGWRGDDIDTTPSDIYLKYKELRGEMNVISQAYDFASKDFYNLVSRQGESFVKAEKSHEVGEGLLNTIFRHGMLKIERGDPELEKLVSELCSLLNSTPKTKAKDDLCDALRYAVCEIPWDFEAIDENIDLEKLLKQAIKEKIPEKKLTDFEIVDKQRNESRRQRLQGNSDAYMDELDEWQELYGT